MTCFSYGGSISKWISECLETKSLDLVSFGEDLEQRNDIDADFNTFMLVSEASLCELNSRLTKKVTFRNFRPNIVVKNCAAFAEV